MTLETNIQPPNKEFHISLKSSHEWLASQRSWELTGTRRQVTEDIIQNAREIESGIDWAEILDRTHAVHNGRRFTGWNAVAYSISSSVGSAAAHLGWSMDSPQVVYMSAYHFDRALYKDTTMLAEKLRADENGERAFISEEARQVTIAKETATKARLGTYKKRLGDSLIAYAREQFGENEEYIKILQNLLYLGHRTIPVTRERLFKLVKENKVDEAYHILFDEKLTVRSHGSEQR